MKITPYTSVEQKKEGWFLHMAVSDECVRPSDRVRKSLTEIQERVVDRVLLGESLQEAADHEEVTKMELDKWNRMGTAFEEITREKLAGRWDGCKMMILVLLQESQKRLQSIIRSGKDSDAIKATGMLLEMKDSLLPNGFRFTLTEEQRGRWIEQRNANGDYWEGYGRMPTPMEAARRS